jgi:hypothetical protein
VVPGWDQKESNAKVVTYTKENIRARRFFIGMSLSKAQSTSTAKSFRTKDGRTKDEREKDLKDAISKVASAQLGYIDYSKASKRNPYKTKTSTNLRREINWLIQSSLEPDVADLWLMADSSELNGSCCFKMGVAKAKQDIFAVRINNGFAPTGIIPIVNAAWAQPFGRRYETRTRM